jgi:internalin A
VTEGIYALLSDEELKVKTKGILTHAELSRILDADKYPSHRYNCLTELMREFQLCFPLNDCQQTFLIPGILPKEEPENTQLKGDTLEFQYHYRILPDSILSRFIVLTHEKIHEATYWRTGVMLEYREGAEVCNIARIKSDPEEEKIFIAVSGRESTRRSFLSLIRDTFTKIHNSFANLEVSQWVPVPGYPHADPLDYEELLGLEEMGENTVRVGKLKLKLDLRQLLDGYEAIEVRRKRQMGDRDFYYEESGHSGVNIHVHQSNSDRRSTTVHQHGQGDNFGGDNVDNSQTNNFNGPMSGVIGSDNASVSNNQFI